MYSCQGVFMTIFFLERFWREFKISFKSHKPVSKSYRPKKDNFCLLMTPSFPFFFLISYTSNAFIDVADIPFSREKCPKINRSVKTPRQRITPFGGLL